MSAEGRHETTKPPSSIPSAVAFLIFLQLALLLSTTATAFSPPLLHNKKLNLSRMATGDDDKMSSAKQDTDTADAPRWCPDLQIFVGGVIPQQTSEAEILTLISENSGWLPIFGYGSLCWKPGDGTALAHPSVRKRLGVASGWKRCWAQKSTDHRGVPAFPGVVCNLMSDVEVRGVSASRDGEGDSGVTETLGSVYFVPPELTRSCLEELDFREKGGYSRDIIPVTYTDDDSSSSSHGRALLYRGTIDNPAFWRRALLDLEFTASVISSSIGPSGKNTEYLFHLETFLKQNKQPTTSCADTQRLAQLCRELEHGHPYFLFGAGSNQYNQLQLNGLDGGEDVHTLTEMVLVGETEDKCDAIDIYAGGGHSALLTQKRRLYLWGNNDCHQLGRHDNTSKEATPLFTSPLTLSDNDKPNPILKASLGHAHTLVLTQNNTVYAFGHNTRGQVNGNPSQSSILQPIIPAFLQNVLCVDISAGVSHSAVITKEGGCLIFGNNNEIEAMDHPEKDRGCHFVQISCGWRHTVLLDDLQRVWTVGGYNKYGQLGRDIGKTPPRNCKSTKPVPILVDGELGKAHSGCFLIDCGWSHNLALVRETDAAASVRLYGWGRNDKGQLGMNNKQPTVTTPTRVSTVPHSILTVSCGAESSIMVDRDNELWTCGWNEHGNLGTGDLEDTFVWSTVLRDNGVRMTRSPTVIGEIDINAKERPPKMSVAMGGGHFISMII